MEELLINDNEIIEQSKNEVRTIADAFAKSKAYYNALAANVVTDYLRKEGLVKGELVNLHSSARFLADFDVADIQLQNLHIDVRGVFDENEIFIPKKHFENKILPDIYLVAKFNEDLNGVTLLGYVEPAKINKQNQNDEYYFVNKSILTPVSSLAGLIASRPAKTQYMLSDETEASLEKLIMLYMDHDIDALKLEKLVDYLKNSVAAREKLVEFENFERLSYLALKEFKDLDVENNDFTKYIKTIVSTDEFSQFDAKDELSVLFDEPAGASGLFLDDEEPAESEEEAMPSEEAVAQAPETTIEEIETVEDEPVEELETEEIVETSLSDEFDVFDEVDEFGSVEELDLPEALTEENIEEESVEDVAENVVEDEPEAVEEVQEEVIEEEETVEEVQQEELEEVSESLTETLVGEDLEFQVEGLEDLELSEEAVDEVELEHVDIQEEDLTADVEETTEEPAEVNVAEELALDEVELDGETVVGLTEEVIEIDDHEDVTPEISMDVLGDIEFLDELEPEETENNEVVETVSDEEVDLAIAQSVQEEEEIAPTTEEHSSDADNLDLDELLSMESDLSATDEEDAMPQFKMDDEDEEDETEVSSGENVDAAELELMFNEEEHTEAESETETELPAELAAAAEEPVEEGTDFAFAVDAKPAQKNLLVPIAALVAVVGLIGAGAWYFLFNGKTSSNNFEIPETTNTGIEDVNINDVVGEDISLESNEQPKEDVANKPEAKAPETPAPVADIKLPAQPAAKEAEAKPEPLTIQKIKKDFSQPNSYLSVSKIVWDVPEYLTYNEDFSGYLQTLGSTMKLNLSSDLLLISENPMFDKVRVKIQLKESGNKYSAEIEDGCGVKSIDDLVLQSVKNTLNLLKPPVNSLDTADEDLYITIYL